MSKITKLIICTAVLTLFWNSSLSAQTNINVPGANHQAGVNGNTITTFGGIVFAINSTISGGTGNVLGLAVNATTISGGSANNSSTNGDFATIGGGEDNSTSVDHTTVAGGTENVAGGLNGSIGGGWDNATADRRATVAGGRENQAMSFKSNIGGGWLNVIGTDGACAAILGGELNEAQAMFATIAGGGPSDTTNATTKLATRNLVTDEYGTIGGGGDNQAGDNAGTQSDAPFATVSGGATNVASDDFAVVSGGLQNTASGHSSGVSSGWANTASGAQASITGGAFNAATAQASSVPGGIGNWATGLTSLAAGRTARAVHAGAFVWGDSTTTIIASTAADQVTFQASGGARVFSNSAGTTGPTLAAGGANWVGSSDRNLKENFEAVSAEEILEKVVQMPVTRWNLKSQSEDIKHIGPMAQDFYAAFGLGTTDLGIGTLDADGVVLAAIQGLNMKSVDEDRRIDNLDARLASLEQRFNSPNASR